MNKQKQLKIECTSCGGTGVFQGAGERDGAYLVCKSCKGTGCITYYYKEFTGRKTANDCKRVYTGSMGYVISDKDVITDGKVLRFSTVGCTYAEWLNGETPKPIKFLGCPLLADQGACHKIKGFVDECNELNGGYIGSITNCKNKCNADECWERFENSSNE